MVRNRLPSPARTKAGRLGLNSVVGHSIAQLLPAVYNSLTDIWQCFSGRVGGVGGGGGGGGGRIGGIGGRGGGGGIGGGGRRGF